MDHANQMQHKLLTTLHSIVDGWALEWVEIVAGPYRGTIRLMEPGQFRTVLKIEYEFEPERCRLVVYREGKHICGRCSIDYDDGLLIEQILARFRRLLPESHPGAPATQPVPAATGMPASPVGDPQPHGGRFGAFALGASKSSLV